jgi:hypothetical protein
MIIYGNNNNFVISGINSNIFIANTNNIIFGNDNITFIDIASGNIANIIPSIDTNITVNLVNNTNNDITIYAIYTVNTTQTNYVIKNGETLSINIPPGSLNILETADFTFSSSSKPYNISINLYKLDIITGSANVLYVNKSSFLISFDSFNLENENLDISTIIQANSLSKVLYIPSVTYRFDYFKLNNSNLGSNDKITFTINNTNTVYTYDNSGKYFDISFEINKLYIVLLDVKHN